MRTGKEPRTPAMRIVAGYSPPVPRQVVRVGRCVPCGLNLPSATIRIGRRSCSAPEDGGSTAPHKRSPQPRTLVRPTAEQCSDQHLYRVETRLPSRRRRHHAGRGVTRGTSSFHRHSTTVPQTLIIVVTLSDTRRSNMVPPAGFEPALPPPETGRPRDRLRLPVSYLGFLFASCVSGDLHHAVVRSTRHSTTGVLSGRPCGAST